MGDPTSVDVIYDSFVYIITYIGALFIFYSVSFFGTKRFGIIQGIIFYILFLIISLTIFYPSPSDRHIAITGSIAAIIGLLHGMKLKKQEDKNKSISNDKN
ncbi:hypothetical protein [Defluviitalea phaphyphila]|uniref:hypothetical protein n=1 Tax=Defluviitalea phaphyphila TaxID=1473580 RepID=UPI000730D475|nr:hypothetical protein [Defluviitalea phaphyphila]